MLAERMFKSKNMSILTGFIKAKFLLSIVFLGIIVVAIAGIIVVINSKGTIIQKSTNIINAVSSAIPQANRNGFPSLTQLENVTNFASDLNVANKFSETEYVNSPTNYKLVALGTTSIVYLGQKYSQLGSISSTRTISKVTSSDKVDLYSYAEQLNGLFNNPLVKVKKTGSCQVAGQNGNGWDVYFNSVATYSQSYLVCTNASSNYLMSLEEGAHLGLINQSLTASIKLISIGNQPQFTPNDL